MRVYQVPAYLYLGNSTLAVSLALTLQFLTIHAPFNLYSLESTALPNASQTTMSNEVSPSHPIVTAKHSIVLNEFLFNG